MSTVGRIEKKSQQRVVAFFRDTLGYACLGNWIDREDNRDIEPDDAALAARRADLGIGEE